MLVPSSAFILSLFSWMQGTQISQEWWCVANIFLPHLLFNITTHPLQSWGRHRMWWTWLAGSIAVSSPVRSQKEAVEREWEWDSEIGGFPGTDCMSWRNFLVSLGLPSHFFDRQVRRWHLGVHVDGKILWFSTLLFIGTSSTCPSLSFFSSFRGRTLQNKIRNPNFCS